MQEFNYKAKDSSGKVISGTTEALTKEEAIEKICQKGLYPVSVDDGKREDAWYSAVRFGFFDTFFLRSEVTNFTRHLASLLKSGIPILKSIGIVSEQAGNKKFKDTLQTIFNDIRDGKNLSESLSRYPLLFDRFFISMVHVGEDNGTLPEILIKLTEHRKAQDEIASSIRGASVYPAFIALAGIATLAFIMTNVLPKLVGIIESMGASLPAATAFLIGLVNIFSRYYWALLVLAVLIIGGYKIFLKNPHNRLAIDGFKLKLPIYGKLVFESELVKFANTLKVSMDSGINILKALDLSASVLSNEVVKKEVEKFYNDVKSGSSLGVRMKSSKIFPPIISNMVTIGEESGSLSSILEQITKDYEWKLNQTTKMLMSLFEPAVILFIGIIVGFIVIALLLPIFQMDVIIK